MKYDELRIAVIVAIIITSLVGLLLIWVAITHSHEVVEMGLRDKVEKMVIKWETGNTPLPLLLTVVQDEGDKLVVGIGHDILPHDDLELGDTITFYQANYFLNQDLNQAIKDAYSLLHNARYYPQDVRAVLACMCFQLGKAGTSKFKKMFAAIEAKDYHTAADEMLNSKWAKQTTRRAQAMATIMRGAGK